MIEPRREAEPRFEKDALLKRVPDFLAAVFAGRRKVLDVTYDLYQVESHLVERLKNQPAAAGVDIALVRLLLETLRREIVENIPAYVCRRCREKPDVRCSCGGKRWLTLRESDATDVIAQLLQFQARYSKPPN